MTKEFLAGIPGFYQAVPDRIYHGFLGAVSNSMLSKLMRSPAHLQAYLNEPAAASSQMIFGTAYHMAVLEPARFDREVMVAPRCMARVRGRSEPCGSPAKFLQGADGYCGRHRPKEGDVDDIAEAGFTLLPETDYEHITRMRDEVLTHPAAALLLEGDIHEGSALWQHPEYDALCKGRIDHWSTQFDTLVDLKSTRDPRPEAFQKTNFYYGYYRQGAMYLEGLETLGTKLKDFTIIAQEKEPPYSCFVYRLDDEDLRLGRQQVHKLLELYVECRNEDKWPGPPPIVHDLRLPSWSVQQIYETL